MCYSKAQGGLRCPSATRPRLDAAIAAFREAKAAAATAKAEESPEFPALKVAAAERLAEVHAAYAEYAAHPTGAAALTEQLAATGPESNGADTLRRALEKGAHLRERAFAIRDAAPRMGRSSQVLVQGRTAAGLVRHHGLQDGDRITITHGGTRQFQDTGIFRGTQRGGDNGRGQLRIEHTDGRIGTVQANAITGIQPARTSCSFCDAPATHWEALMFTTGGEGPRSYRCDAHTRETLVPNVMSGNL